MKNYRRSKYKYLPHDKYVVINEGDSVLRQIVLKLPDPPELHLIDGYGLPPSEQVFKRHETPTKLIRLEERAYYNVKKESATGYVSGYFVVKEFWNLLEKEQDAYKEEIEFIKKVQWHRFHGYWFFCYGKPTYLTPWHYDYLNFGYIPDILGGKPDYRDVDRRTELFDWYTYTTRESFKNLDKDGFAIPNDDGTYEMVDMGHRVCFGPVKPKRRRRGESTKGCRKLIWIAGMNFGVDCTLTADTGEGANKIWKKNLVPSFQKEPVFIKPLFRSSLNPNKQIEYMAPHNVYKDESLGSKVYVTESASEGANDKAKLYGWLDDEPGKTTAADIRKRYGRNKLTMAQGHNIHGWSIHPSTVEEMDEGGAVFEELWNQSCFYRRNAISGQTISGLFREFVTAADGRDGNFDKWGYSVMDTPTEAQIATAPPDSSYVATRMGSKESLEKELEQLKLDGSTLAQSEYSERLRRDPMDSQDCWTGTTGDMGFDKIILTDRTNELRIKEQTRPANFVSVGDRVDLVWNENGRFDVSEPFFESNNQWCWDDVDRFDPDSGLYVRSKRPLYPSRFTIGFDPYDYSDQNTAQLRENKSTLSDGGISVFWEYDSMLDSGTPVNESQSYCFVMTYRARTPGTKTLYEDALNVARYVGGMLVFENNKRDFWRFVIESGYAGYLKYMQDPNGELKKAPGIWAGAETKDEGLSAFRDYVAIKGKKEKHYKLLKEALDLRSKKDLTNKDLLASSLWALMGSRSSYAKQIERIDDIDIDISGSNYAPKSY